MPSKPPGSKPRPQGTKRAKSQSPALALGGAAAAVAAVAYYVLTMSKAVSLSPSDSAALKQVFFSGEPWLVECGHSVSPAFYDAEGSLPKGMRVGLLDCAAALPSGKTTIQRFKLSPPKRGPTVLLFANADAKPALAPVDAARTGVDLAKWAARVSQPRVVSVATVQLFEAHCTKRKWCALALGAGARLPSEERAALTKLAAAARAVRFIAVDGSKLLLPDELMRVGGGVPAPSRTASPLLLLKQAGGEVKEGADEGAGTRRYAAKLLPDGLSDAGAVELAIGAAMAGAAQGAAGREAGEGRAACVRC